MTQHYQSERESQQDAIGVDNPVVEVLRGGAPEFDTK